MQFILTRNTKAPERDLENAGIDCYVPFLTQDFVNDLAAKSSNLTVCKDTNEAFQAALDRKTFMIGPDIYIAPQEDVIIPSGIRSKFDKNLALVANNKSGVATKRKLVFGASTIDSGYEGEWHFHLINSSHEYRKISCGDKIIQFIPHVISTDPVEIVDMTAEEFYKDSNSKRGEGWQGSTGLK